MTGYLFVSRDVCRNRQSVDRTGQLLLQDAVDGTAAVDPGLPDKLRRPDLHPEMRFAALAMAGMAAMLRALVDHRKMRGLKGGLQLGLDPLLNRAHATNSRGAIFVTHA